MISDNNDDLSSDSASELCIHEHDAERLPCVLACVGCAQWSTALAAAMLSARRTAYARSASELERALQRETCLQRRSGLAVSLTAVQAILQQGMRFLLFRASNEHLAALGPRADPRLWRYTVSDLDGTRNLWQAKLDAADSAVDASPRARHLRLAVRRHVRAWPGAVAFHDTPTVHEFFVQAEQLLGGVAATAALHHKELPIAFVRHAAAVEPESESDEPAEQPRADALSPVDHTLDSLESAADAFSDDDDDSSSSEFDPKKRRKLQA